MHSKKTVLIVDLMNAANMELIRLDFRSSALSRHDKEFRRFCNYCTENGIQAYDAETGPRYFRSRFGLNIGDANIKLNRQQLDARNSIRFLDDIFQFGYALRYSHHDYIFSFEIGCCGNLSNISFVIHRFQVFLRITYIGDFY